MYVRNESTWFGISGKLPKENIGHLFKSEKKWYLILSFTIFDIFDQDSSLSGELILFSWKWKHDIKFTIDHKYNYSLNWIAWWKKIKRTNYFMFFRFLSEIPHIPKKSLTDLSPMVSIRPITPVMFWITWGAQTPHVEGRNYHTVW